MQYAVMLVIRGKPKFLNHISDVETASEAMQKLSLGPVFPDFDESGDGPFKFSVIVGNTIVHGWLEKSAELTSPKQFIEEVTSIMKKDRRT